MILTLFLSCVSKKRVELLSDKSQGLIQEQRPFSLKGQLSSYMFLPDMGGSAVRIPLVVVHMVQHFTMSLDCHLTLLSSQSETACMPGD